MSNDRASRAPRGDAPAPPPRAEGQARAGATTGSYFLGRYRVVDALGIGGMAAVHLGRVDGPGGFQKWVAIKQIHPHLVDDESFVQMFLDEARVAARIAHPNVASVYELGKQDDTYWIAMEYLHGEPLREVIRALDTLKRRMPSDLACRVIADAAEGLHAAHELRDKDGQPLGLVHRDVTPHNLFVTYDGITKVVDFGIAKWSARSSVTRVGTIKGKIAYMSPEQVHVQPIDRRTDVFALGVVLWELTTGRRLFRCETDVETLAKVQACVIPRPSEVARAYPSDLEPVVLKALARDPRERFASARDLSRALQQVLMRRGVFVGGDEVGSYLHGLFAERIAIREARLRWASEVTGPVADDDRQNDEEASAFDHRPTTRALVSVGRSGAPSAGTRHQQGAFVGGAVPPASASRPGPALESLSCTEVETAVPSSVDPPLDSDLPPPEDDDTLIVDGAALALKFEPAPAAPRKAPAPPAKPVHPDVDQAARGSAREGRAAAVGLALALGFASALLCSLLRT